MEQVQVVVRAGLEPGTAGLLADDSATLPPTTHHSAKLPLTTHHSASLPPPTHHSAALPPPTHHSAKLPHTTHHSAKLPHTTHHSAKLPPTTHHSAKLPPTTHHSAKLPHTTHHSDSLPPPTRNLKDYGSFCRHRKALYFWSLGISLYLELFCFLFFITFVSRNLCSEYTPVLTEGDKITRLLRRNPPEGRVTTRQKFTSYCKLLYDCFKYLLKNHF